MSHLPFEVVRPIWWREDRDQALTEAKRAANKLVAEAVGGQLGELSIAPHRYADEVFNGLSICSQPLDEFGGAAFWLNTGSSTSDVPAEFLVDEVGEASHHFVQNRELVAAIAEEARRLTIGVLAESCQLHLPSVELIALARARWSDSFNVVLVLAALGPDLVLRTEIIRFPANDSEKLVGKLQAQMAAHQRRAELSARYRASGWRGMIDETARRMMAAAGMNLDYALDQLSQSKELGFRFDKGEMRGNLAWKEGVLTGEVFATGNEAYVWNNSFTFRQTLPQTFRTSLIGCPLSMVADGLYLPVNATVTAVSDLGDGGTRLDLSVPVIPF